MPVNVRRGKHVVDEDLIKALDSGQFVIRRVRRVVA